MAINERPLRPAAGRLAAVRKLFGRGRTIALTVVAVSVLATPAAAHPHVWVTVETEVLRDGEGRFTGMRHHWTFDELYSSFATVGLDTDGDGSFSRKELEGLAQINIEALGEFDYFVFAQAGGEDVAFQAPEDYWLEFHGDKLTLRYTLPLVAPAAVAPEAFAFQVYDPTFYIDFQFSEGVPVLLAASAPGNCAPEMKLPTAQNDFFTLMSEAEFATLDPQGHFGATHVPTVAINCTGA